MGSHRSISKNSKGFTDFYYSKYILHSISKAILDRLIKSSIIIIWWGKWQMKEEGRGRLKAGGHGLLGSRDGTVGVSVSEKRINKEG